ncbi:MAG TPA: hypothetical protein VM889_09525 [Candidatus Thermoplasmatota archaeon]|nr:hypothetical protein [Candidatus Thermoplasmatota archaeon]
MEAIEDLVRRGAFPTPEAAVADLVRIGLSARGAAEHAVSADTAWG